MSDSVYLPLSQRDMRRGFKGTPAGGPTSHLEALPTVPEGCHLLRVGSIRPNVYREYFFMLT